MKKVSTLILLVLTFFGFGFAFRSMLIRPTNSKAMAKRVTGIGGIFFKCKNAGETREWYRLHLGLNTDKYGTNFEWWQGADSTKKGSTQRSPFNAATKYFEPSKK